MPIVVVFKAMGVESDQEIISLIGTEPELGDAPSWVHGAYGQSRVAIGHLDRRRAKRHTLVNSGWSLAQEQRLPAQRSETRDVAAVAIAPLDA